MTDDTFEAGYQAAIADLRWLAGSRSNYKNPVEQDVLTALHLADILDGANDGRGWNPSWLWDEWDKQKRHPS